MPEDVAGSPVAEPSLDASKPVPIRFWWLKRFILCGLLFIVTVAAARLWWGWDTARRLQTEIDRIVAAGEPIFPKDFNSKFVSDKDNSAKMITDAVAALDLSKDDSILIHFTSSMPNKVLVNEQLEQFKSIVSTNATALDRLRTSRSLSGTNWGITIASPALNTMLPMLGDARELSRLLAATASYQFGQGNHREAIELLRDLLGVARSLDEIPAMIAHSVANQCVTRAARCTEALAPQLVILSPSISTTPRITPATREQVDALIAYFQDIRPTHDAHVRSMYAERMYVLDGFQVVIDGSTRLTTLVTSRPVPGGLAGPLEPTIIRTVRPVIRLEAINALEYLGGCIEAVRCATWHEAVRNTPEYPETDAEESVFLSALRLNTLSSSRRALFLHYAVVAERHLAALTLSIRLYEVDHGQRPGDLDQLVPDYISALPADPYSTDGMPMRFNALASPPVVYSVGENGVDDHGEWAYYKSGPSLNWEKHDFPYFLNGKRPHPDVRDDDQ